MILQSMYVQVLVFYKKILEYALYLYIYIHISINYSKKNKNTKISRISNEKNPL